MILLSTDNMLFHYEIRNVSEIFFFFLDYWKNFVGTHKRVRISNGKPAIGVRAIVV